jgi:hypothetical protein
MGQIVGSVIGHLVQMADFPAAGRVRMIFHSMA